MHWPAASAHQTPSKAAPPTHSHCGQPGEAGGGSRRARLREGGGGCYGLWGGFGCAESKQRGKAGCIAMGSAGSEHGANTHSWPTTRLMGHRMALPAQPCLRRRPGRQPLLHVALRTCPPALTPKTGKRAPLGSFCLEGHTSLRVQRVHGAGPQLVPAHARQCHAAARQPLACRHGRSTQGAACSQAHAARTHARTWAAAAQVGLARTGAGLSCKGRGGGHPAPGMPNRPPFPAAGAARGPVSPVWGKDFDGALHARMHARTPPPSSHYPPFFSQPTRVQAGGLCRSTLPRRACLTDLK